MIEVQLDLGGYPVTLLDTAGIRDSDDAVEQEGVRRARARAADADLVLWVTDGSDAGTDGVLVTGTEVWVVTNKIDQPSSIPALTRRANSNNETINVIDKNIRYKISSLEGEGVNYLISCLAEFVLSYFSTSDSTLVSRERHRKCLEITRGALENALSEGPTGRLDIVAEELRLATQTLGRLTGRVDVEDILDVIFRDFCIGK